MKDLTIATVAAVAEEFGFTCRYDEVNELKRLRLWRDDDPTQPNTGCGVIVTLCGDEMDFYEGVAPSCVEGVKRLPLLRRTISRVLAEEVAA